MTLVVVAALEWHVGGRLVRVDGRTGDYGLLDETDQRGRIRALHRLGLDHAAALADTRDHGLADRPAPRVLER